MALFGRSNLCHHVPAQSFPIWWHFTTNGTCGTSGTGGTFWTRPPHIDHQFPFFFLFQSRELALVKAVKDKGLHELLGRSTSIRQLLTLQPSQCLKIHSKSLILEHGKPRLVSYQTIRIFAPKIHTKNIRKRNRKLDIFCRFSITVIQWTVLIDRPTAISDLCQYLQTLSFFSPDFTFTILLKMIPLSLEARQT